MRAQFTAAKGMCVLVGVIRFFLSFRHSKQLQSQKNVCIFSVLERKREIDHIRRFELTLSLPDARGRSHTGAAMATIPYTVAADFHVRADAIDAMKHLIADVTKPSLIEQGCQIYHWSQGAEDPTLFLLYMEWQDKASFEAHVATPHVKEAEQRLANKKMLVEPSREWHFVRL